MSKRVVAFPIILVLVLATFMIVWADIQDYRKVVFLNGSGLPIAKPTAQFAITHNGITYESLTGIDINSNAMVINARVGDTVAVADLSHSNRGKTLKAWDFQYTRPDGKNEFIKTQSFEKAYTLDVTGTYTFSLCVRDNIDDEAWTSYWGNWSDNGNHRVIGNNPGQDLSDPSDDFDGYWYFTRIVVIVEKNKPKADFKIYYKGENVTDNSGSPVTVDPGDKSLVLEDCSTPFSAAEPIVNRKWSYWDVTKGWKEIPGSINKTTVNISEMDAGLLGSGQNKAFKLECTSSTGGFDDETHTAYFNKVLASGYIIYYRDQASERDIYPAKERPGLGFGTYIEHALPAPADSELVTPSPTTIVLDAETPFTTFTFYYKMDKPPADDPPSAILEAPDEVMAGQPVRADGSDSWSNNPGGYIADYNFEYEGANLISDNNSSVRIWYPNTGTYTIYLEVEDEKGSSDLAEHEITVTPPIPIATLSITGKLKENRKVIIDSSHSTSTAYYSIDSSKTIWEVTAVSGGTAADIKYAGTLNGNASKDLLFKKAGSYKVKLTVTNTFGRSASTETIIDIAEDFPPVADLFLPTPAGAGYKIYRDRDDSNLAAFEVFNESYSSDGDVIDKAVMIYCYDSDNDGNYQEESWYYSKDGTGWLPVGMAYADMVGYFNIFSISSANPAKFILKSKEVGRYYFVIRVMETIPEDETIPEFINESDYRRSDTFD